eukprot:Hpha_TRINITY_DN15162_c1_g1::TRINITY_DN15162_c1_g1_i1::g.128022::m.128022
MGGLLRSLVLVRVTLAIVGASSLAVAKNTTRDCTEVAFKRFVFVFNSGHQGSTSLAGSGYEDSACRRKADVTFEFEAGRAKGLIPQHLHQEHKGANCMLRSFMERDEGDGGRDMAASIAREAHAVRSWYKDRWTRETSRPSGPRTIVVSGHDSLLYYRGVLATLNPDDLLFVRLRRDRYETARSWEPNYAKLDPNTGCPTLKGGCPWYCFCPFAQPASVRLPVTMAVWKKLSPFQRSLWYVDETEARWQALVNQNPGVATVALPSWSKTEEKPYGRMLEHFTRVLGLHLPDDGVAHLKVHTKVLENVTEWRAACKIVDDQYIQWMGYKPWMVRRLLLAPYR